MITTLFAQFGQTIAAIQLLMLLLTALVHIIIASGIAKDVGLLNKRGASPLFIPGFAWVLAALIGGILTLGLYWLLHHSSLAR